MPQAGEEEDVARILAQSGPAGIHEWFQARLAKHPEEEKVLLKQVYQLLRPDHPTESLAYGERLFQLGQSTRLAKSLVITYGRLGDLVRAQAMADCITNPSPADARRAAQLKARVRLLQSGLTMPEPAVGPPYIRVPGRVLYVLHSSLPYASAGYAIRSQGLARAIRQLGYDMTCVTRLGFPWDETNFDANRVVEIIDQVDGVPYIRLPSVIKGYRRYPVDESIVHHADRLCALARILRPSVIHAASNFICGAAANLAARKLGLPSVYEVRGLWEVTMVSRFPLMKNSELYHMFERMEMEVAREASAVFAITGSAKSELVRRGVPEEKVALLPNGIDTDKWHPVERNRELEGRLGLTGKTVIGYLGSLLEYEGLDLLLRAAHRLRQSSSKPFALLIVGDGRSRADLENLSKQLQLGETVLFSGRVPHHQVASYYSLLDIAPFPRKGLEVCEMISPLKPFEAMAMGKTIVCSDVAALAEIVSHNVTGLLHRKDDADDLADCLELLLGSPELRSRLGAKARDWVCANRDWKALARPVCDTYDSLTTFALRAPKNGAEEGVEIGETQTPRLNLA